MLHFGEFQTNKNWFHLYTLRPSLGRIGLTGKHAAKGENKKGPRWNLTFVSGLVIMNLFNSLFFKFITIIIFNLLTMVACSTDTQRYKPCMTHLPVRPESTKKLREECREDAFHFFKATPG